MVLILIGWVLFSQTELPQLWNSLKIMFSFRSTDWVVVAAADTSILMAIIYLPLGILCAWPGIRKIRLSNSTLGMAVSYAGYLLLFALCVLLLISSTYNPFIYFRF